MSSAMMDLEPMKVEFPVANTFIQYPAHRGGSLEEFLQERSFQSCPASRMASLEEAPEELVTVPSAAVSTMDSLEVEYKVKHTFVDVPAMRDFSLEGFLQDREIKSCPASRMVSLEEPFSLAAAIPATPTKPASMTPVFLAPRDSTMDSLEEFFMDCEAKSAAAARVGFPAASTTFQSPTFFQYPLLCDALLGVHQMRSQGQEATSFFCGKPQQDREACDMSTAAPTDVRTEPVTPDLSDNEAATCTAPKFTINLTEGLRISSAGSAAHTAGTCKPCAFLWKPEGCKDGQSCQFCHLCPVGEVRRRKKEKLGLRKMARGFRNQATGFYGMY